MTEAQTLPLETPAFDPGAEEIRRLGTRVAELVAEHLTGLPRQPVFAPVPPEQVARYRAAPLPLSGESIEEVLRVFEREIAPHPFGNGHPGFFGWVNSPPAAIGVFAAALAAAMNPSVAGGNHAAVHVEHQVLRWFTELLGLPDGTRGLLVSGTSQAAIVALGAARHAACAARGWKVREAGTSSGDAGAPPRLVAYASAEGHGCHRKAIELLGIGSNNLRAVPTDEALRIRPDALDAMLREDTAAGRTPMAVIASVGTVNTGAIDPLAEIAHVCARHGVWLHVDGAYGGPAVLLEEHGVLREAIARADSIALDPHKWMYVPVDAGVVLARNGQALREAFSLVPPYLRTDGDEAGVQGPPWFSEYGIEQTRPFRALKVWMAMRHFGVDGYRRLIARDVALARYLADSVRETEGLMLWEPQGLSIVCFRCAPESIPDGDELDALNRRVLSRLQLGGKGFLSSTVMSGRVWLRACVVNPRSTTADIDALLAEVADAL